MATTIQIVVAGALLLAWIWALGRPLTGSVSSSDYRRIDNQPDGLVTDSAAGRYVRRIRKSAFGIRFLEWAHRPAVAWRRQLMLATMFATFASFLLAIALRGTYVLLFIMMVTILVIHLIVAASIGSRMLRVERAVSVRAAKRRVQRPGGIAIRAERAGVQSSTSSTDDEDAEGHAELDSDSDRDAFDVAAELASQLAETATPVVPPLVIDDELTETVVPSADGLETGTAEATVTASDPVAGTSEGGRTDEVEAEPIFRRAAKDKPARGRARRKAKPIYIESQLDEDDDEPRAKAVNEQ